ncbi:MAG: hypothetical protein U5J99_06945 [Parvularculaceae bacterium]|nr:hypothetical protein [Parvularculaceae bacterium]
MRARRKAITFAVLRPDFRPLAVMVAAALFFMAQAIFAAHASTPVEDLLGHSAADCAVCLAGGLVDDPSDGAPDVAGPGAYSALEITAIPAEVLTQITGYAASPRGPPTL